VLTEPFLLVVTADALRAKICRISAH